MDTDPATQFNADPDPQSEGEAIIQKQKKGWNFRTILQSFFIIIYEYQH